MAKDKLRTQGLEKELKYFLTKQGYETLLRGLKKDIHRVVNHNNIYFDDAKLRLRKRRFGLRLRFLDGRRAVVTLKHPAKGKGPKVPSLKVRHEYEEDISYELAQAILANKLHIAELRILPIKVLKNFFTDEVLEYVNPLGGVNTVRTFLRIGKGLELELDRFEMFHQKFYELEVETKTPKKADEIVHQLLKEHHIPYHPITKSKLGRFIQEWRKQRE